MIRHLPLPTLRSLLYLIATFTLVACSNPVERHQASITAIAKTSTPYMLSGTLANSLTQADRQLQLDLRDPARAAAYNQALTDAIVLWSESGNNSQNNQPLTVDGPNGSYKLSVKVPKGISFDRLVPASYIHSKELREHIKKDGIGVPVIAIWERTEERAKNDPFMSAAGYSTHATATIDFKTLNSGQRLATIQLISTVKQSQVTLQQHSYPLAYNYSALTEYLLTLDNGFSALGALFRPHKYLDHIALKTAHKPDNKRIPVIFVHGLASEPRTWQNVYNELHKDPVLRQRYQVYFFRYPSGVPVLYSAAKLREKLAALQQHLNSMGHNRYSNKMVMVGHSMGGLISKSQVQDSGDTMWLDFLDKQSNRTNLNEAQLKNLQSYLQFKPNPNISRVVFIATPHRGSKLADYWFARQLRKLIEAPASIIRAPLAALDQQNCDQRTENTIDQLFESGIPTSMDDLSPQSKYVKGNVHLPLRKGLKIHSIVGNLKGHDLDDPECSDGVVPYTSAHLGETLSEKVVPYGHSAHEHKMAIEEIRRILRLHLTEL